MAFFTFTLPAPGRWFTEQTAEILPNRFQICYDYQRVHQNSLRVLEELCHTRDDLTIAFSGGADSWFLVLCLHQLIHEGRVPPNRVQIWTGNYTFCGKSLTPNFLEHCRLLESLGLVLHTHNQPIEDPDLEGRLLNQFYQTASHSPDQIAQYCLIDCFPGRVIIPEGGPTILPPPVSTLSNSDTDKGIWAMLSALEYERNNRILFHSLDRDLWSSWLIPENVNFSVPMIEKEQFDALSSQEQFFWRRIRYHWRYLLYGAGFPKYRHLFLWKKPSFLSSDGKTLRQIPKLGDCFKKMGYMLETVNAQKNNLEKKSIHWMWQGDTGYYSHCWVPIVIE